MFHAEPRRTLCVGDGLASVQGTSEIDTKLRAARKGAIGRAPQRREQIDKLSCMCRLDGIPDRR